MKLADLLFNLVSRFVLLLRQLNGIEKKAFLSADTINILSVDPKGEPY